jgi:hypothetical protein
MTWLRLITALRLAVLLGILSALEARSIDGTAEAGRRQIPLREGWLVKQLETDKRS